MTQQPESLLTIEKALGELTRSGGLLLKGECLEEATRILMEQAVESTRSDLGAYYAFEAPEKRRSDLKKVCQKFRKTLPDKIAGKNEMVNFISDCREIILCLSRNTVDETGELKSALIHPVMQSGAAVPLVLKGKLDGILFVNSKQENHYNRTRFRFLENLAKLSSGLIEQCDHEEGEKK